MMQMYTIDTFCFADEFWNKKLIVFISVVILAYINYSVVGS